MRMHAFRTELKTILKSKSFYFVIIVITAILLVPFIKNEGVVENYRPEFTTDYMSLDQYMQIASNKRQSMKHQLTKDPDNTMYAKQLAESEKLYDEISKYELAVSSDDPAAGLPELVAAYKAMQVSKVYGLPRISDWTIKYYQQFVTYKITPVQLYSSTKIPAVNRTMNIMLLPKYVVLILILLACFFANLFRLDKKHQDFQNVLPKTKLPLFFSSLLAKMAGATLIIFIPFVIHFVVVAIFQGVGSWHYPIDAVDPLDATPLRTFSDRALNYFAYLLLLTLFMLCLAYFVRVLVDHFLVILVVMFLFVLFSQASMLSDYMNSRVIPYVPSVYIYIDNVFRQLDEGVYVFKNAKAPDRFRDLFFLSQRGGMFLLAGYSLTLTLLTLVLTFLKDKAHLVVNFFSRRFAAAKN